MATNASTNKSHKIKYLKGVEYNKMKTLTTRVKAIEGVELYCNTPSILIMSITHHIRIMVKNFNTTLYDSFPPKNLFIIVHNNLKSTNINISFDILS